LLITQTTPDTSGVIGEAFFMQDADKFMLKVFPASVQVNQFTVVAGVKLNSHSVNGEVTARKVVVDRAGRYRG
jgi:hypothetical protein